MEEEFELTRMVDDEWREYLKPEEYPLESTDSKILKNLATHSSNTKSKEYKWEHYLKRKKRMFGRS